MASNSKSYRPATLAVRGGQQRGSESEHSEPIYTSSSFVFSSAAQAAAVFSQEEEGNVYSRFTNPTVNAFETRLAMLEGGEACLATSSGMSALLTICMSILSAGDHIVSSKSIFGASYNLLNQLLPNFGVECDFVDPRDLSAWDQKITNSTKLVFFETPSNPLMELVDIQALVNLAKAKNPQILVCVDNCFCSPALQTPLSFGADLVMHSATKHIDGQGRCVGGAVVGSKEIVGEKMMSFMRTAGPTLSAFNAWVFLKGLETLELRVKQASANALEIARYLAEQPDVERVYYPGLESHADFQLCQKQQSAAGAVVSFELQGGRNAAWKLIDSVQLLSRTANLGDTRTTITHPYTTTHARWSEADKLSVGIKDNLIRVAVGLEDPQDIIEDLNL